MSALLDTAKKLQVNPAWLWSLIQFESGANPAARNPISGARGLIQFMHFTAKELGYKDADDLYNKNKTFDKQITGPVYLYLKKYAPFPTKQALYMAVFYPAARAWPTTQTFPAIVRKQNPGIDTVQDYINHVERKPKIKKAAGGAAAVIIAGILFALFQLSKKG